MFHGIHPVITTFGSHPCDTRAAMPSHENARRCVLMGCRVWATPVGAGRHSGAHRDAGCPELGPHYSAEGGRAGVADPQGVMLLCKALLKFLGRKSEIEPMVQNSIDLQLK